jgi:hypothetical protein
MTALDVPGTPARIPSAPAPLRSPAPSPTAPAVPSAAADRMRAFMRSHIAGAESALDLFARATFCEGRISGLRDADAITCAEAGAIGNELQELRARRASALGRDLRFPLRPVA